MMSNDNNNNKNNKNENEIDYETIKSSDIMPLDQKDMRCAPSKKFENGSCIPVHVLSRMAISYNKHNQDQIPLDTAKEIANPAKYKRYLLKQFKTKLGKDRTQRSWMDESFVTKLESKYQKDLEKNTWRPEGPEGKFEWLNTSHIEDVVKQYEEKYPEFKFLGAVPMDFDDLPGLGIKNMDFKQLMDSGKTKIGVVFNTDDSTQAGSHWNALYADLKKGTVYFSDSYGTVPEPRIKQLMTRIAKAIRDNGGKPIVDYNRKRHQEGDNACGLYSVNFILRSLRGDSFAELTSKRMPDEIVNKCRNFYFT